MVLLTQYVGNVRFYEKPTAAHKSQSQEPSDADEADEEDEALQSLRGVLSDIAKTKNHDAGRRKILAGALKSGGEALLMALIEEELNSADDLAEESKNQQAAVEDTTRGKRRPQLVQPAVDLGEIDLEASMESDLKRQQEEKSQAKMQRLADAGKARGERQRLVLGDLIKLTNDASRKQAFRAALVSDNDQHIEHVLKVAIRALH